MSFIRTIVFCLLFCFIQNILAFNRPVATIPFDVVGSYIVISVGINGKSTLRLILDSGVRNTIITELFKEDSTISLKYGVLRNVYGLGNIDTLKAYESLNNDLQISNRIVLKNKGILVLQNDIFNFTRQTGTKINGLLGSDFFRDYIVKIDYNKKLIKFYDENHFKAPCDYNLLPIFIEDDKMYVELTASAVEGKPKKVKMLIDTGAELTAWFQTFTPNAVSIPSTYIRGRIGVGLGGEINGRYARFSNICFANNCVNHPIVVFPDSITIAPIIANSDRDGTVGSQLLYRFNLIFDIKNNKIYFKPNANFKHKLSYNIAGIEVVEVIPLFPQYEVINVWEDSPASAAGIKKGDIIIEINHNSVYTMTLQEVRSYFEKPSKRRLPLLVERDGKHVLVKLNMKSRL